MLLTLPSITCMFARETTSMSPYMFSPVMVDTFVKWHIAHMSVSWCIKKLIEDNFTLRRPICITSSGVETHLQWFMYLSIRFIFTILSKNYIPPPLTSKSNNEIGTHFHEFHNMMWASVTRRAQVIGIFKATKGRITWWFPGGFSRCYNSLWMFWRVYAREAFKVQQITLVVNLV